MKLWLAALSYLTLTVLIFGDPLQPIGLATRWADRLGIPFWRVIAVISVVASTLVVMKFPRNMIPAVFRPTAFVVLGILMPTIIVGLIADSISIVLSSRLARTRLMSTHSSYLSAKPRKIFKIFYIPRRSRAAIHTPGVIEISNFMRCRRVRQSMFCRAHGENDVKSGLRKLSK